MYNINCEFGGGKDFLKDDNGLELRVELAKAKNDLRYMITDNGIPIHDACLWLDFVSLNSYLTGERYAYALLRYFRFLKVNKIHYKEVMDKTVIEEYIKDLLGLGNKIIDYESQITYNAMSLYITVVKSFYLWLEDERKISVNPLLVHSITDTNKTFNKTKLLYGQIWKFDIETTLLSRVTYRKQRDHLKWYTEKEVETIRKNLPTIRDEAVFAISVETGMRIGEILGLKINHFNPFEATLEIVRERNIENRAQVKTAERTIHIYSSLVDLIQEYIITERASADINYSNFLFLNLKGKHMGQPLKPRNFLRILKDSGEKSGLKRNEIRTHSGRSTRVQQLVELMRDKPELGITQTYIDEELGWRSERSIKSYEKGYSMRQKRKILERIKNVSINKGEG